MSRYKGLNGSGTAGGNAIGEIESFTTTLTSQELTADVMGNSWSEIEVGLKSATGQMSVLRDPADSGQTAISIGSTVALVLYPMGNTSGLTSISGDFVITEEGITSSVGELVKTSYSFRNSGQVALGTVS